jgi:small-conductance mechanosensitive channel
MSTTELIADPFVQTGVLAVVGAIITRILLRKYPAWRLVVQGVFFTALTVLLLRHNIIPYEVAPDSTPIVERFFVATAKIIWWVNAAWLMTSCARVFLIFERRPREGRLLQDLVVATIYLSAGLSVVAYVFAAPVGTLIATSGVFAIILGLALQSTLADVFSGLALNLSKVYEVGDWIVLNDGIEGRVIETNWRATHLLNGSNDLVILPNNILAKAQLTNLSSPNRSHGVKVRVRVAPTLAPSSISEIMRTVLLSSNSLMSTPAPTVEIKSLDAQAIEFELAFRVKDFSTGATARHEVYDLIYRHAKAAGLTLAQPKEAVTVYASAPTPPPPASPAPSATALRLVDAVPLFACLTAEERHALADSMTRRTWRKSETLVEQGTKVEALFVIRSGVLIVVRHDGDREIELGRLSPGDFFGEAGLFTGGGEPGTVRALTFATVYEVGQAALAKLMHDRPTIADEISVTLSRRASRGQALATEQDASSMRSVSWLVARIRHVFELPVGS